MEELWHKIGMISNYAVSNMGRVKNINNGKFIKIRQDPAKKMRAKVVIMVDGKIRNYSLHRLVAHAFIPNPNRLAEVNHIDGNCYNNCASNLEWISRQDNMRHLFTNGLRDNYCRKVIATNRITGEITIFDKISDCAKALGLSSPTIIQSCKGKRIDKTYELKYKSDNDNNHNDIPDDNWYIYPECSKYEVSRCGQVRHSRTKRIMKGSVINGYRCVLLSPGDGKPNLMRLVHRMVAMAIVENPDSKPYVDHIDTNCLNNRADNLQWVTHAENMNTPITKRNMKRQVDCEEKNILNVDIDYNAKQDS